MSGRVVTVKILLEAGGFREVYLAELTNKFGTSTKTVLKFYTEQGKQRTIDFFHTHK